MDKFVNQATAQMRGTAGRSNAPYAAAQRPQAPTHEDIARRAYEIYRKNGFRQGQCEQNWRQAEASLRNEALAAR